MKSFLSTSTTWDKSPHRRTILCSRERYCYPYASIIIIFSPVEKLSASAGFADTDCRMWSWSGDGEVRGREFGVWSFAAADEVKRWREAFH